MKDGLPISAEQMNAVSDAYTTLRALCATYGKHDDTVAGICAESERQLVEAFPHLAFLETVLDEEQSK
jgi:hypothetical protein